MPLKWPRGWSHGVALYSHCPITRDQGSTVNHYVFMLSDDWKQDLKINGKKTGGRSQPATGELVDLSTLPVWPVWLGCLMNRAAWFSKEILSYIKCLKMYKDDNSHVPTKAFSMCSVHLCTVRLTVVVVNIDIIANRYWICEHMTSCMLTNRKGGHGGQFSNHWKEDDKKIPLYLLSPLYVFTLKHQNKNFSSGMHVLWCLKRFSSSCSICSCL